jgi:nuclear transport factor 2 (NTF2) superfamily protein
MDAAMTTRSGKNAPASAGKALRAVDAPPDAPGRMANALRLHPAPEASEEPIGQASRADRSNAPRLSNGMCIRENRTHQKTQRIGRAELRVPASDEMGYKKLFTRFEEAFTTQDIAMLRSCLSPAFQWHLPNGQVVYGREEALSEMERRFAMPNGPRFSASVWRFKDTTVIQTYDVEYAGPDGRWRQSRGMDLYEIGDGLITRKDAYWKMIP